MDKSRGKRALAGTGLLIVLIVLDRVTKNAAVGALKGQPNIILIPGVLELAYVENLGAAFGVLQNAQIFFILMTIVICAVILWILHRMPLETRYRPLYLTLIVVLAGAVGNLIDRVTTVYVVDFIYFSLIDFPVFNVADICVTVAMALLIVLGIWYYKEDDFSFLHR